ncbi:MAG: hypothetical protein J7448_10785 [Thermomicrobium sp.]|nr:hypothetical protein [Thermomicrobium sp.]
MLMPSERAGAVPSLPPRSPIPESLRKGVALGLALLGALFGAATLFYLWRSFREDYPELRFDLRVLAALLFGYGSLFAVSAWALWRGRVRLWLPLAALVGFLLPFLSFTLDRLYYAVRTGEFRPERLLDALRPYYGPPFTAIHAVLYGCLVLALFTFWVYRSQRQVPGNEDR